MTHQMWLPPGDRPAAWVTWIHVPQPHITSGYSRGGRRRRHAGRRRHAVTRQGLRRPRGRERNTRHSLLQPALRGRSSGSRRIPTFVYKQGPRHKTHSRPLLTARRVHEKKGALLPPKFLRRSRSLILYQRPSHMRASFFVYSDG